MCDTGHERRIVCGMMLQMTPPEMRPDDEPLFQGAREHGPGAATVQALSVLDILVAIKVDLTVPLLPEGGVVDDLQRRQAKACNTIEMAIRELKSLAGLSPANGGGSSES
jgi:hypothetical protein